MPETYWKLAREDGFDFYTGRTLNYRAAIGQVVTCPDYAAVAACGSGIHVSQDPNDCFLGATIPCSAYRVEPVEGLIALDAQKSKARRVRIIEEITDLDTLLGWDYSGLAQFLAAIPSVSWFQPDGRPDPQWRLFLRPTWDAAREAAGEAAWEAAGDAAGEAARAAAGDAAWEATLYAISMFVCAGLPLDPGHRAHSAARWQVWTQGYALFCDVAGVLYVYGAEEH